MLGNDIIDIKLTAKTTNWQRTGWLDKVCTTEEQSTIHRSVHAFLTVWRIWTMKESAYKISIQSGESHSLNPTRFHTIFLNENVGEVLFGNQKIETFTTISSAYIHTIAWDQSLEMPAIKTGIVSEQQQLKIELLRDIGKAYAYPIKDLKIESAINRVPFISHHNERLECPLSMSHHGKFSAYTYYKYQ